MNDWDHLNKGNRVKSDFLGINIHKANHRLTRRFIFHLAGRLRMLDCYRCHKPIATYEEMSIDHKEDWLKVDPALFWDVENLALSHKRCNKPRSRRGIPSTKRVGSPDPLEAWCTRHQKFLPVTTFGRNVDRWNGLQNVCKSCMHDLYIRRSASTVRCRKNRKEKTLSNLTAKDIGDFEDE